MPNRMFDPVSNPFAIQNLLEKKVETFVEQRDERAEAVFSFDAVVMANPVHAFSEQTIEDPAAADPQSFQADWMDAGHEFAGDPQAAADDFVAVQEQAAAGFSADGQQAAEDAAHAHVITASDGEPQTVPTGQPEPMTALAETGTETAALADGETTEATAAVAGPDPAQEPADELAQATLTESAEGRSVDTDVSAEAPAEAVAEAVDVAEDMEAEAIAAEASAVATPAETTPEPTPVVAHSGITEEELNARLEAAREEGRAEVREAVRAEAHQQGYVEGQAAGYAQARAELDKEYEDKTTQLQSMIEAMQALSYNPDAMFEPMKMLSVHLAEQLVRGELTQSPQVIARLVDNCLRELNASGEKAVIIHLHPEDVEQYKPQAAQFGDALVLRADPKLERGSVRASLEGSVVEDLIQRRVAGLKKGLMQAPAPSWRANAGRLSDRIADGQRGGQPVEDITITAARKEADPKPAAKSEGSTDTRVDHADTITEAMAESADSVTDKLTDNGNA